MSRSLHLRFQEIPQNQVLHCNTLFSLAVDDNEPDAAADIHEYICALKFLINIYVPSYIKGS